MSGETGKIHLTIPAADSSKSPDTIIKPQALRDWVDNLPYANPLGTAQAILISLKLLNRHPDKLSQRPDLMAIYISPFYRIIDTARKLSCESENSLSKTKNSGEILSLATAICSEMAYGFKHIVLDEAQAKIKITQDVCASSMHLAIQCLSLGLMFEMSAHRTESRSTWREIFQLLIRSQQLGIASLAIPEDTSTVEYEASVLNSFKCILLTSILDSTRLTPNEIWASYDYLTWYSFNARLTSVENASEHPGNYLMPRDGMQKPSLHNPDKPPSNPGNFMICETHRLNLQVSRHLEMLSSDETVVIRGTDNLQLDQKKHMLRQMLHIWHTNPRRRHERQEKFDRLSCAFGLGSIYHFLKNGTMRDTGASSSVDFSLNSTAEPKLSDSLSTYECRQEDISASGMGIITSEQNIRNLKIGQMIITEGEIGDRPSPMRVGIVRRIIHQNQTNVEIGVQFLPGRLLTASALPEIFGRKHKADLQPCILLEMGEKHPKAIITPHMIYEPNRHYILDITGGDTKRVIAGKLLESTGCLDCFEYNVLEHA